MNNNIFPCLWFDGKTQEAAAFYTETFGGRIAVETPAVISLELFGQKLMLLNGGPYFEINASISLMVISENEAELIKFWKNLSEDGKVLMELGEYPWSKHYGWVRDRFGVTWQLYLGNQQSEQRIIPSLMFIHHNNGRAMEAMRFYTSVFPDSEIKSVLKYGDGVGSETHEIAENIQHAHFTLSGYNFFCMDNSYDHQFDFNEGISMVVMTDNQEETDRLWTALSSGGGRESMCGWLKDQYGVSWQVVPKRMVELMNLNPQKVMAALQTMQKIEIFVLEAAVQG